MTNWRLPRPTIIEAALTGLRSGYYQSVAEAAERLTTFNYRGASPPIARSILERDVTHIYYERYGGRSEHTDRILSMAATLHAEGWRYIQDHRDTRRGFWRHRSGADVNQSGGAFASFDAATKYTFDSETRKLIIKRRNDHAL